MIGRLAKAIGYVVLAWGVMLFLAELDWRRSKRKPVSLHLPSDAPSDVGTP